MHIFLAIAILCLSAFLLAALTIPRHVRICRISAGQRTDFAHHLFAAFRDPDVCTPRTLPQQNIMDIIAKTSWNRALEPTLADTRNQSISSKRF
jgi:hypothetical protein